MTNRATAVEKSDLVKILAPRSEDGSIVAPPASGVQPTKVPEKSAPTAAAVDAKKPPIVERQSSGPAVNPFGDDAFNPFRKTGTLIPHTIKIFKPETHQENTS